MIDKDLPRQLNEVLKCIEETNLAINNASSIDSMIVLVKELNHFLVKKYTIEFKIEQISKGLPILGEELEAKPIKEDNPKTNKSN